MTTTSHKLHDSDELLASSALHEKLAIDNYPAIYLRLTNLSDTEALYKVIVGDRKHLEEYQYWAKKATPESTKDHIKEVVKGIKKGRWLQYRIMSKSKTGKDNIIGTTTFYDKNPDFKQAYLGYWLTEPNVGYGYATAAAKRMVRYGFEEWGLDRILLTIEERNTRSQEVAKKLRALPTETFTSEELEGRIIKKRVWEINRT